MKRGLNLTTKEARELVKLLGEYQTHLESEIECHTVDGATMPDDPGAAVIVAEARRRWRRAENWVARLTGEKPLTLPAQSHFDRAPTLQPNTQKEQ